MVSLRNNKLTWAEKRNNYVIKVRVQNITITHRGTGRKLERVTNFKERHIHKATFCSDSLSLCAIPTK